MQANSDITLYNTYYDKESDKQLYIKTHIYGVNFQGKKASIMSDKGLVSQDIFNVYIPFDSNTDGKKYIEPKKYEQLEEYKKDSFFYV